MSEDSVLGFDDRAETGRHPVDRRLGDMAEALRAHGLTVVRRNVYHDETEDGTGGLGWLWLCAEPRRFPDESHDLLVRYSEADADWQVSAPDGRGERVCAAFAPSDAATTEAIAAVIAAGPGARHERSPSGPPVLRDLPDWVSLVLGGVATSMIVPFVQAVAGRSADDAYAGLRARLTRRGGPDPAVTASPEPDPEPDPGPHAASGYLSILDPDTDLQLVVPDPVPPEAVRQLTAMDRSELRGRTLVWDDGRQEWFRCRRA